MTELSSAVLTELCNMQATSLYDFKDLKDFKYGSS